MAQRWRIRDQLISSAHLSTVKNKFVLEEDFTMDEDLNVACQVQAAVKNAALLSASSLRLQAVDAADACFRGRRAT